MLGNFYTIFETLEASYKELASQGIYLDYLSVATWTFIISAIIEVFFFVLKGFGIFTLSKRAGLDKAFLAFIPFASFYQLGRVVGPMSVFRKRVKNLGLWVGLLSFLCFAIFHVYDYITYYDWFQTCIKTNSFQELSVSATLLTNLLSVVYYMASLAYIILFVFLGIAFFNFYAKNNRTLFAILGILFDPLFAIFVFVVRKNERYDYYGEIRKMQEYYANLHRQAQQNSQKDFSSDQDSPFTEYKKPQADDDVFQEYSGAKKEEQSNKPNDEDLF